MTTVGSDYANTEQYNLSTDLNVTPYYDDYEDTKEYYRILYKPGFAVQGRELTQMQTILQKQIARFGRHIFVEGTIVIPGNFQLFANNISSTGPLDYVKIRDIDNSNNNITLSNFAGGNVIVRGNQSNVTAQINIVADGSEISANATKTLYVDYGTAAPGTNQKVFIQGETLVSNVGNLVVLGTASSPIGKGSVFRISEGVIFSKEHFVYFPQQEVILDRYSDNPTAKVGFNIIENIVDYTGDSTLLDPALESSNYSAPGADRLKLTAILEARAFDDPEDLPNFTTLFTIKDGVIQTYNQRTQYSILQDELAKRTFDESGDYYVSGLDIELRENADSGTNGGRLPASENPDANLISVRVSPGTAYVKGYEVGIITPRYLTTPKSTSYQNVRSQIVSAFMGSYVTANNIVGHLELDEGTTVSLLDTFNNRISDTTGAIVKYSDAALSGNIIGTATVMSAEYNSGILGTAESKTDIYLSDIRMLPGNSFTSVKSLYINNNSTAKFGADIVPDTTTGTTVLREAFDVPLLYYTGSDSTRLVKDDEDLPRTVYSYITTKTMLVAAAGTSFVDADGTDTLPYTGTLSTTDKKELFLSFNATVNSAIGTCSASSGGTGNTITGTGFSRLSAGEKIQFAGASTIYTILSITNDTQLTLKEPTPLGTAVTNAIGYRYYGKGSYIDLSSRTVSKTVGQNRLEFDLGETLTAETSASISFRATRTDAVETSKILRPNRYVKINCASAGVTGPYNLGFADVYKIKSIVKKSSTFPTSNTDGSTVTSQFIFNNGQKDTIYDIATIKPTSSLASTDRLLVELDYFIPNYSGGRGFFTVDSYPANDVVQSSNTISTAEIPIYISPSSGKRYDLRNHIDFRLIRTATANDVTDPVSVSASENPGRSNSFNFTSSSIALIAPSSEITFDYSYYVPRKDIVHITKDKQFSVTMGQPGSLPVAPQIPADDLALAELTIAPFPSISPYYAKIIGRQDIASSSRRLASVRQTMRDLGVMKSRITNLEYYASLSLLEKSAADMLIQDEFGMDRFKNGIFVDTFRNHALGDTKNSDYRIVVDPEENSIRPLYSMQSINYDYISGDSNIEKYGDLVTLKYDEVEYSNVSSVTATLNTEKSTFRFIGNMILVPENDIWIDTTTLPPNVINIQDANIDGMSDAQQVGGVTTVWNAWQTYVSGYKVYKGIGDSRTLVGTYSTYDAASKAAKNVRTTKFGATIETDYQNERTGSETYNFADTDSVSLGTKLVNTEIVPYIRPQVLLGSVTGIKPYAKYKVFFDNIDMTDFVRPVTYAEFTSSAAAPGSIMSWTYNETDDILANENGEVWFRLRLPNTNNLRFTVGSKVVKITDSLTNSDEETSYASKTFFASGVIETKQDTILSTRQVETRSVPLYETNNSATFETLPPLKPPDRPDLVLPPNWGRNPNRTLACLAYAMPIKVPNAEEGIFLTSVDIFVAQKHPTLGMWCEVRELDAGGGITGNAVPFSEVWFTSDYIENYISPNGKDTPLNVKFQSPIFLYANKSYAFIIHPEAANPNYYFWISRIGQEDINTKKPVVGRAYTGTTFTTNNDTIWVPEKDVDLTCKWYRASFRTNPGTFVIANKPKEKLYLTDIQGGLEGFGEPFVTGDRLTLTISTGTAPIDNDFIIGGTSQVNAKVMKVSSGTYYTSNIRFGIEGVQFLYGSNGVQRGTGTITSIDRGAGYLEYYKESPFTTQMILTSSNGKFSNGECIFDISDEGSATISSVENLRYSVIDFEPAIIKFSQTGISHEMSTTSNTGTTDAYFRFDPSENYTFDEEKAIFSRSNEIKFLSSKYSNNIRTTMTTSTDYLSPVFDIGRSHSIIVDNLINSDATGEASTQGGQLFNKYISKIVTLADYQDAEDMNVFLTAYRPPSTDVRVWIKLLNGQDSDPMTQKTWIEMEKSFGGDITYSSIANKDDFKEYKFTMPASSLDSNGVFTYVQNNVSLKTFKSFQIKVGLIGTNSAVVPRVADLRTIALQI